MEHFLKLALGILLSAATSAQMPPDGFLIVGRSTMWGGTPDAFFISDTGAISFRTWPTPAPTSMAVAMEDGEVLYFANSAAPSGFGPPGPFSFYRATVGPNLSLQVTLLGTYSNPTGSWITALAVAGDNLWFATRAHPFQTTSALVGTLSKTQTNQTIGTVMDLGQLGYPQTFIEARSNGRDVFLWGYGMSTIPGAILSLDTSVMPPVVHLLPSLYHTGSISNGKLIGYMPVAPGAAQFTLADPLTGAAEPIPMAYYAVTPDSLGYNPWTRTLLVRDFYPNGSSFDILWPNSQWQHVGSTLQNGMGAFLLPIHEEPVIIYGRGCTNATGNDPRMTWTGLPERGGSVTLTLLRAEPGSLVLFWLGMSRTSWGSTPLPLDGALFGAPGCRLLAAPDVWQIAVSDTNGVANLNVSLPNDPALVGLHLFAQTGSTTTVNPFGFVTSDALELRCR